MFKLNWDCFFKNHDLSNEEKNKIRYVLTSFFYDLSKLFILGIVFFSVGFFKEYLMCAFLTILIRPGIGGFHFRHYISCLLFSFAVIATAVILSASVPASKAACLVLLTGAIIIFGTTEPVSTAGRDSLCREHSLKLKLSNFVKVGIFLLFVYIFPFNRIFLCGTYLIILLAFQLVIAYCTGKKGHALVGHLFSLCLFLFDYIRFTKVSLVLFGEPEIKNK